jgi:hypothetical protein
VQYGAGRHDAVLADRRLACDGRSWEKNDAFSDNWSVIAKSTHCYVLKDDHALPIGNVSENSAQTMRYQEHLGHVHRIEKVNGIERPI